MGKSSRFQKKVILDAIKGSGGIISTIASRLGCAWSTAKANINRFPDTKRAFEDEAEQIVDFAEGQVIRAIRDGDLSTSKWFLAVKSRGRGYNEYPSQLPEAADNELRIILED